MNFRFWLGSFLAMMGAASCGLGEPSIRNVLLISIDTLRADYLSSYGFPRQTTPHLDAIARQGVLFQNVLSPVPITLPAHSSMLTGTLPPYHGVHDNLNNRLADSNLTLAELLKAKGFLTAAIISSFVLDSRFNLSQGFDIYNDRFEAVHKIHYLSERKGDENTRLARAFLDEHRGDRFFLFLHYYDPHDGYQPPEPFASRFADDRYAGEVAFVDNCVGQVIEKLNALGLSESTLLVVTGDHGEMLGDHRELTHGYFIYQSALKVPLIFRGPGVSKSGRLEQCVSLIDIVPTVASLLGIEVPEQVQGQDLSPWLKGRTAPVKERRFYAESFTPTRYYGANSLLGLVGERWKYIETTRPELYDLQSDPGEIVNLVEKETREAQALQSQLKQVLKVRPEQPGSSMALDEDSRLRLESLGYLGRSHGGATLDFDRSKEDPKDLVEFYRSDQKLSELIRDKKYGEARVLCETMLRERPSFIEGYLQMARIATAQGDPARALQSASRAVALGPDNAQAQLDLADLLASRGRLDEAVTHFRRAVQLKPGATEARAKLARALTARGEFDEAATLLSESLATEPQSAETLTQLGFALASQGKLDLALANYRRALALDPGSAEAHSYLGAALASRGELEEAIDHFEKALHAKPDLAEVHDWLGVALRKQGKPEEATRHFRQALRLNPRLASAHNNLGSLLGSQGNLKEAVGQFREALAADPHYSEAHNNLGLALRMTGEREEALAHFRAALAQKPDWPEPMNEIAWIVATRPDARARDPKESVRLAERAAKLTGNREPVILDTLAAAYAASGDFERATGTAHRAVALAAARSDGLANEIAKRLELYRQKKPYREPARTRGARQ